MKEVILHCDIQDRNHSEHCSGRIVPVMFDHDQEDGKSNCEPYFELLKVDICDACYGEMLEEHKFIYGFGAMGNNVYSMFDSI